MTEQNQLNRRATRIRCEYCGGRIDLKDRIRVTIDEFKNRDSDPTNQNAFRILAKNYHKKCYMERYKDYQNLKRRFENEN